MLVRALVTVVALSVPVDAQAAGYVVHRGETLGAIAQRSHVSIWALARINSIRDPNRVRAGQLLFIPAPPQSWGYRSAPWSRYSRSPWAPHSFLGRSTARVVPMYRFPYGSYRVRWGDTLFGLALRYHTSVAMLRALNPSLGPYLLAGQTLTLRSPWAPPSIPRASTPRSVPASSLSYGSYRVRWGDTLFGLALRYHTSVGRLRALNPSLGPYLLAGQSLNVCRSCASGASTSAWPVVRSSYAIRRSVGPPAVRSVNRLARIMSRSPVYPASRPSYRVGLPLRPYTAWRPTLSTGYQARALITAYARQYGLESSLPLAIGAQESGFQQTAVSRAGAIGVMQVEPDTARQISALLGRPVNLYSLDDNIHAGVFWLAHLVAQYGGNERLAAAAYYQGSSSLASRGYYTDTVRYVSHAMVLKTKYGG